MRFQGSVHFKSLREIYLRLNRAFSLSLSRCFTLVKYANIDGRMRDARAMYEKHKPGAQQRPRVYEKITCGSKRVRSLACRKKIMLINSTTNKFVDGETAGQAWKGAGANSQSVTNCHACTRFNTLQYNNKFLIISHLGNVIVSGLTLKHVPAAQLIMF